MKSFNFEWDVRKNIANSSKHGVSLRQKVVEMRKSYDFSKAKRNPYARRLKRQLTIRLDESTVAYFRELARDVGVPYQTLINLYLGDCASSGRRLNMRWLAAGGRGA